MKSCSTAPTPNPLTSRKRAESICCGVKPSSINSLRLDSICVSNIFAKPLLLIWAPPWHFFSDQEQLNTSLIQFSRCTQICSPPGSATHTSGRESLSSDTVARSLMTPRTRRSRWSTNTVWFFQILTSRCLMSVTVELLLSMLMRIAISSPTRVYARLYRKARSPICLVKQLQTNKLPEHMSHGYIIRRNESLASGVVYGTLSGTVESTGSKKHSSRGRRCRP